MVTFFFTVHAFFMGLWLYEGNEIRNRNKGEQTRCSPKCGIKSTWNSLVSVYLAAGEIWSLQNVPRFHDLFTFCNSYAWLINSVPSWWYSCMIQLMYYSYNSFGLVMWTWNVTSEDTDNMFFVIYLLSLRLQREVFEGILVDHLLFMSSDAPCAAGAQPLQWKIIPM